MKFYWNTLTLIRLYVARGCAHATVTELSPAMETTQPTEPKVFLTWVELTMTSSPCWLSGLIAHLPRTPSKCCLALTQRMSLGRKLKKRDLLCGNAPQANTGLTEGVRERGRGPGLEAVAGGKRLRRC